MDFDSDYSADYDGDQDFDAEMTGDGRSASYGYSDGEDGDLELEYDDEQMEVDPSEDGRNVNFSHQEGEEEEEEEAEHDHVWSRSYTRPHVENRHQPKNIEPESIGDILRRVLGMKKRKKKQSDENVPGDYEIDQAYHDIQKYHPDSLEEGDEEIEPDDDEDCLTEDEKKGKGTWSPGEGSGAFGGRR